MFKKIKDLRDKIKLVTYKLFFDIEVAIDFKKVLDKHVFNIKVIFTLKGILKITKKKLYNVIINSIK